MLDVGISNGIGETVLVCTGVAMSWPDGVAWVSSSLLGVLEEGLLLA